MFETSGVVGMIEEFVTGAPPSPVTDRVLATVLFTDIVSSTDRLAEIGDRAWREQLDRHDAMVRSCLADFQGREVDTAGDGFFAVFDGPARAIQCATAVVDGAQGLGIEVRLPVSTPVSARCEAAATWASRCNGARIAALAAVAMCSAPDREGPDRRLGHRARGPGHARAQGDPRALAGVQGRVAGEEHVPGVERGRRVHGGDRETRTPAVVTRERRRASRGPGPRRLRGTGARR